MTSLRSLLAVVLLLGVTACTDDELPDDGPEAVGKFGPTSEYVALGDSYTAAPNTGAADGEDGCGRTQTNYPHLIAEKTGMTLTDVSCGSASTEMLTGPQQTHYETLPPQLDAITPETDLVTLRIGGENEHLWSRLWVYCIRPAPDGDDGDACEDATTDQIGIKAAARKITKEVRNVVRRIKKRAPDAEVLLIGYPQIFPEGREGCLDLPLKDGNIEGARRINIGWNTALEDAAKAEKVPYIDVWESTAGHDICGKEPWIAGAPPRKSGAAGLHPYVDEAENVAKLVLDELDGLDD